MRLLIIDKTAGLAASHERHQAIARQPQVDLHVLGPRHWIESGREVFWTPGGSCLYTPHLGRVFGKDYYARAGYYSGLLRAIRRAQPNLIQILEEPWSISALQTLLAAAAFAPKTPVLFYTWENIYRPWTYPSRASRLYAFIDRIMHARSAAAVCATHQAQEVLRQKGYTKPTRVIPYGIPEFFFQADASSPDPNRPFTIGFIGRLLPMKGIDLLLDALEHLPGARLLMVGDGEEKETYQAQCKQNEQAARVEWIPPQPEENIPGLLARMDVLVLPSRRVHGWQEQLGRVLIEAMAVGVPVVGSTSGAIPEVIGDAGLVFQENDAGDLAAVLRRLMDNPGQRDYYKTLGRKRAENHFTWPRFAKELIDFHRTLVSDS